MYTITKEFHFSAAHSLDHLPAEHPCSRVHGHNYVVKIELKSNFLNYNSFVKDYNELNPIKEWIDNTLDHQNLNQVLPATIPTAENIARYIYEYWKWQINELSAVEVSETPKTNCRYESDYN